MKKVKYILLCIICVFVSACSNNNNKRSNDNVIITNFENYDATFYKDHSTNYAVSFTFISSEKLVKENLNIYADITEPLDYDIEEIDKNSFMRYHDLLVTKKLNWKSLADLKISKGAEDNLKANKEMQQYEDEFETSLEDFKELYAYEITVDFNLDKFKQFDSKGRKINQINLRYKQKLLKLDIGTIRILSLKQNQIDANELSENHIGFIGKHITPTKKKVFKHKESATEMDVNEDIHIKKIFSAMDNVKIDEINISIKDNDGNVKQKKYKTNTIDLDLKKGSIVSIAPKFSSVDEIFDMIYHQSYNYLIEYDVNGHSKSKIIESGIIHTDNSVYSIMNEQRLGDEYKKYYLDFVSVVGEQ